MALKPQDRYQSADQLRSDVERWLGDESVSAYRESWIERSSRWARRHTALIRSAFIALLLVSIVTGVAAVLTNRARQEAVVAKQQALQDFKMARDAIDTWLKGPVEDLKVYPGVQHFAIRIIRKATEDYQQLVSSKRNDPQLELERGRTFLQLGDLYSMLQSTKESSQAYESAEAVFESLTLKSPKNTEFVHELANCRIRLGQVLADTGEYDPAKQKIESAIGLLSELKYDNEQVNQNANLRESLGTCLLLLGDVLKSSNPQLAETHLRKSVIEFELAFIMNPEEVRYQHGVASARQSLGNLLQTHGRLAEAESLFQAAVATVDNLGENEKLRPAHFEARGNSQIYLAAVLRAKGEFTKERIAYEAALRDFELLLRTMPHVPRHRELVALTKTDLGQLLYLMGFTQEALQELQKARDIYESLVNEFAEIPRYHEGYGASLDNLAQSAIDLEQFDFARSSLDSAGLTLRQLTDQFPHIDAYRDRMAVVFGRFGLLESLQQNFDASDQYFQAAVDQLNQMIDPQNPVLLYCNHLATIHWEWGTLSYQVGDRPKASDNFKRSKELWQIAQNSNATIQDQQNYIWFMINCAENQFRDHKQAIELAELAVRQAALNPDYQTTLGAALYRAGKHHEAIRILKQSIPLRGFANGRTSFFLAMASADLGLVKQANEYLDQGVEWTAKNRPGNLMLQRIRAEAAHVFDVASE